MNSKKITDNDLYLFLQKDNLNIDHITRYIPSVENLHEKDRKAVLDKATNLVNEKLLDTKNDYYDIERMSGDCMAFHAIKYFTMYDLLLGFDKERTSLAWSATTISLLDQYWKGQEIIEKYEPNFLKKKIYKDSGLLMVQNNLKYWDNTLLIHGVEKFEGFLNYIGLQLNRYGNHVNWKNLLEQKPLLSIGIHATYNGYNLTEKELLNIFVNLGQYIRNQSLDNKHNQDTFNYLLDSYCQLLLESKFFQNTLVPQNNVKTGLSKFLPSMNLIVDNKISKQFFEGVLNYPEFSYVNMNYKVDKRLQLEIMGKYCLKPEEITVFQETLKNMVKPSPAKKKI